MIFHLRHVSNIINTKFSGLIYSCRCMALSNMCFQYMLTISSVFKYKLNYLGGDINVNKRLCDDLVPERLPSLKAGLWDSEKLNERKIIIKSTVSHRY